MAVKVIELLRQSFELLRQSSLPLMDGASLLAGRYSDSPQTMWVNGKSSLHQSLAASKASPDRNGERALASLFKSHGASRMAGAIRHSVIFLSNG